MRQPVSPASADSTTACAKPPSDRSWAADTSPSREAAVMTGAETYLLVTAMLGWDLDSYQRWLEVTLTRLAGLG